MVNYKKSKLYKLKSTKSNFYFIDSTRGNLTKRLHTIKCDATSSDENEITAYDYFNKIGWNTVKISLVKRIPCENKEELKQITEDYINDACISETNVKDELCLNFYDSFFDLTDHVEKYKDGKIYMITCTKSNYFYIGSTCLALRQRLKSHHNTAKKEINRKVYKYFNEIGWDTAQIRLLENFACDCNVELLIRENEFISEHLDKETCLNSHKPYTGLTTKAYKEKWYKENQDDILEDRKQYYEDNKEEVLKRVKKYAAAHKEEKKEYLGDYYVKNKAKLTAIHKERFECECGSSYSYKNKCQHLKSTKHKDFLLAK